MNKKDALQGGVKLRGFEVDLLHHALLTDAGEVVELRPQALDLLCLLASHAGQVMDKQTLLTQVWKGVFVTDDSLVQAIGDIRRAINDQNHQTIRTVPKRGYRLIAHVPGATTAADSVPVSAPAPLQALPLAIEPPNLPPVEAAHPAQGYTGVDRRARKGKLLFWLAAIALMGALVYLGWQMQASAPPPRLSIVVLPFVNASADPAKEYIADSITEDVTVQLSHIKGSFVIGRGTAFTYKNKAVDLKALAKDLNVRYILQGTVNRSATLYHVTSQLVDGSTGANLWADSLDVPVDQLIDIREWVAAQIANTLKLELLHAEASQSAKKFNPDSVDLDMQAFSKFRKCWALETCEASYQLFDKVIQMDPGNDTAHAHRIMNGTYIMLNYKASDRPKLISQMNADVAYLEGLGVLDFLGHRALARARYFQGRNEEALQQIEESLKLEPNDSDALGVKPLYLIVNGQAAAAIPASLKALAVSPHEPDRAGVYFFLCHASMHLAKFQDAIDWCEKSFAMAAGDYWALTNLVAAYTAIGNVEKAALAKAKLLKMNPEFSISWYKALKLSSNPVWRKEIEENVWANLRRAGIPE